MPRYVTPREACEILQVVEKTLRNWEAAGKIRAIRTPTGHRRYDLDSLVADGRTRKTLLYCRVSSSKQQENLNRQADYLLSLFPTGEVIKEIGSGLNYNRKGLQTLLGEILSGDVEKVAVTYKDRLARFGIELIEYICKENHTQLVLLSRDDLSPDTELVEDILAIIHLFSSKVYGLKKYKKTIKSDPDIPQIEAIPRI